MNVDTARVNILSLCSGVGMLDEGVRLALASIGIESRVVCHVERESSAAASLLARMETKTLFPAPIWCADVKEFDGSPWN